VGNFVRWNDPPSSDADRDSPLLLAPGRYVQWSRPSGSSTLYLTNDTGTSWTPLAGTTIPDTSDVPTGRPAVSGPSNAPAVYQPVGDASAVRGLMKFTGFLSGPATASRSGACLSKIDGGQTRDERMGWAVDPSDPNYLIAADSGVQQMKVSRD